jgi:hypothetical protein
MTFGPPSVPADASDVEREQTLSQFASLQTRIESCVTLLTNRAQDIGYSMGDSSLAIPELDQHTLAVLSRLCTIHEQRQESLYSIFVYSSKLLFFFLTCTLSRSLRRSEKFDEAQRRQKNAFAGEGTAHILEKQAANVASLLGHDLITGFVVGVFCSLNCLNSSHILSAHYQRQRR